MSTARCLRLALVISSLSSGGAERVMSVMANYWAERAWKVTLITLDSTTSDFYRLHQRVDRVALGLMEESSNAFIGIRNNVLRIARLRNAIQAAKPDVVISFIDRVNVLTLLATWQLPLRTVIMEHTHPEGRDVGSSWNVLRRLTYPTADLIGVLTERARPWAQRYAKMKPVFVMPNPVSIADQNVKGDVELAHFVKAPQNAHIIVSMGRLIREKGFDLLLAAFAKVFQSRPELRLVVLGEGVERPVLEQFAADLGIAFYVSFPGRISNPWPLLRQADLFILSSRHEGFPLALCEAMACGLPVISFDCPSGPREIIRDDVDGVLVAPENVDALSEAINKLMCDEAKRKRLAARAPEVIQRFGLDKIMGMWDTLLRSLIKCDE
jgi:glycosyltransferase involved in cell wall biosynthesis